jgi:hypothetical protein
MRNQQAGILAALFCALGAVSAVAMAYDLSPPSPLMVGSLESPAGLLEPEPAAALQIEVDPVLEMSPMRIVGHSRARAVEGAPQNATESAPVVARDITAMRCTGWRPLEQGSVSQAVRLCQ